MPTTPYEYCRAELSKRPRRWLVTGAAGFIGSHLVERLLALGQQVVGLDNLSTGSRANIDAVLDVTPQEKRDAFSFVEADIRNRKICPQLCEDIDIVLHQAALGSVPRSIKDPLSTHESNVTGFMNVLEAARLRGARRFVYASSSSIYGDSPALPKREDTIGRPLSPYAVSKRANELHAAAYWRAYRFPTVGLRYFNVFGPRQNPDGPYAAVIPMWCRSLLQGEQPYINGDGETSRDFCHVDNAVSANLLAALAPETAAAGTAYNVACGERTTLNDLYAMIRAALSAEMPEAADIEPAYRDFRPGDVRHSLADISRAREQLGYEPIVRVGEGIEASVQWFARNMRPQ